MKIAFNNIADVVDFTEEPERAKLSVRKGMQISLFEQAFNGYLIEKYGSDFTKNRDYESYFQNEIVFDFLKQLPNAYLFGDGRKGFYNSIAHDLFTWNWKIGETIFSDPFRYLEAKHLSAEYKDTEFYDNVIMALGEHFGFYVNVDFYTELLNYCKRKIDKAVNDEKKKLYYDEKIH